MQMRQKCSTGINKQRKHDHEIMSKHKAGHAQHEKRKKHGGKINPMKGGAFLFNDEIHNNAQANKKHVLQEKGEKDNDPTGKGRRSIVEIENKVAIPKSL